MPRVNNVADILTTTTAESTAANRWLTSRDAVKTALGITVTTYNSLIDTLIPRASAMIAAECGLARDNAACVAAFAAETLEATYLDSCLRRGSTLSLPWRVPVTSIVSVTEDGTTLTATTDYRLVSVIPGRLLRVSDSVPIEWSWGEIVVRFVAGFALPTGAPEVLSAACIEQVKYMLHASSRDSAIRSESKPDVGAVSYSLPGGDMFKGALLPQVQAMIAPYQDPMP